MVVGGTKKNTLQKVLRKPDEENLASFIDKCKIACKRIEWLGLNIDDGDKTPLIRKTEAIEKLNPP